jgi:hypothetical protein
LTFLDRLSELFDTAPLPYHSIVVPDLDQAPIEREYKLKVYVNLVITAVATEGFQRCGFETTTSETNWNAS